MKFKNIFGVPRKVFKEYVSIIIIFNYFQSNNRVDTNQIVPQVVKYLKFQKFQKLVTKI